MLVGGVCVLGKIMLPRTSSALKLSARERHASEMITTFGIADSRASSMLSRRLTASFGLSGARESIQYSA